MNFKKQFSEGLLTKNPVTVQLLGMCSVLAITTSLFNGIGMGLSVTIILTCSNILISALRKVIPSQIRIAAYIVIIAAFVTIVDLALQAFLPELSESLGVFIPLIVVNCIILAVRKPLLPRTASWPPPSTASARASATPWPCASCASSVSCWVPAPSAAASSTAAKASA